MQSFELDCSIIRGGTTKGVFLDTRQLPNDDLLRDKIILSLFGSPDRRQINGLGGADPLTSKVALISPSDHPDADIDYRSGEVGIDEASINYSTMCGNLASGAALYARHKGLIKKEAGQDYIRIRNINTGKFLRANMPSNDPIQCEEIDGVRGWGFEINLGFLKPEGPISGKLLPTGSVRDQIESKMGVIDVSIIDCGTLYCFINAKDFGLSGDESPEQIDLNLPVRDAIETLREDVAKRVTQLQNQQFTHKHIKMALISAASDANESDIRARVVNRYMTHKAYPVTGAICLSAAASLPKSIVNSFLIRPASGFIRIAHPRGIIETQSELEHGEELSIICTSIKRTARLLMEGKTRVFI